MITLEDVHDLAMVLADEGNAALLQGRTEKARLSYSLALSLELQALALASPSVQPTYAVLVRSAAALAILAGQPAQALDLASRGLLEASTPAPLRVELEEIAAQARSLVSAKEAC